MARRNPSVAFGAGVDIPQGMTKQHFAYIAAIIAAARIDFVEKHRLFRGVSADMEVSYPRFDREWFFVACNIE